MAQPEEILKAADNLDDAARLSKAIKQSLGSTEGDPQLAEFAAHFITISGGMKAVARMAHQMYTSPSCTALMKHRILDTVLRSVKFANEQAGPKTDLGLASDDDLMRELQTTIARMQQTAQENQEERGGEAAG